MTACRPVHLTSAQSCCHSSSTKCLACLCKPGRPMRYIFKCLERKLPVPHQPCSTLELDCTHLQCRGSAGLMRTADSCWVLRSCGLNNKGASCLKGRLGSSGVWKHPGTLSMLDSYQQRPQASDSALCHWQDFQLRFVPQVPERLLRAVASSASSNH